MHSVSISEMVGDQALFVPGQAHIWIPDEQKFMFVGGSNKEKGSSPLKRAFLYSVLNPLDLESLEDIKLRREFCSLSLIGGRKDQKIIAVGGYSNPKQGEYQPVCEIFDL